MAKLIKIPQKLFGDTAAAVEIGIFGSFAAGTPATTTDPKQVQSLANFSAGWVAAILGNNSPAIEDMNGLFFLAFRQLAYLMERGLAEWDSETNYFIDSVVSVDGVFYKSLTDNNLNNLISDGSNWKEMIQEDQLLNVPSNRIVSGKTRSTSSLPQFIKPNGAAPSFTIEGLVTDLEFRVNNVKGLVETDIVKSGLTLAPGAGNTCLVNDSDAAAQEFTRTWGEKDAQKEYILIDTIGANITSLVGKWASFKISTEYFLGFVEADRISRIYRGYFASSAGIPFNRVTFSDNAVITLMSTAWVFADVDGLTIDVTYNNPVWSPVEPVAPSVGDYWYDSINKTWKEDDTGFASSSKTLVGMAVIDSANCIGARSFPFYGQFTNTNNIELEVSSVSKVIQKDKNCSININGKDIKTGLTLLEWDMASDLATAADMYNAAEQSDTEYYMYLDENKKKNISDISPYFIKDMSGYYHPHNTWKCVGILYNDSGSDISGVQVDKYNPDKHDGAFIRFEGGNGYGSTNTIIRRYTSLTDLEGASFLYLDTATDGTSIEILESGEYEIEVGDGSSASGHSLGPSKNASSFVLAIESLASSEIIKWMYAYTSNVSYPENVTTIVRLTRGDIIRVHANSGFSSTDVKIVRFQIKKLNN